MLRAPALIMIRKVEGSTLARHQEGFWVIRDQVVPPLPPGCKVVHVESCGMVWSLQISMSRLEISSATVYNLYSGCTQQYEQACSRHRCLGFQCQDHSLSYAYTYLGMTRADVTPISIGTSRPCLNMAFSMPYGLGSTAQLQTLTGVPPSEAA